jgi:hypothetical protein
MTDITTDFVDAFVDNLNKKYDYDLQKIDEYIFKDDKCFYNFKENVELNLKQVSRSERFKYNYHFCYNLSYYTFKITVKDKKTEINNMQSNNMQSNNTQSVMSNINRKRTRQDTEDDTSKKQRNEMMDWISASKVRNYLLNEPLLDWLKEFNVNNLTDRPSVKVNSFVEMKEMQSNNMLSNNMQSNNMQNYDPFTKYLLEQGIEFETYVYDDLLKPKLKNDIVKAAESFQSQSKNKFMETVDLMKKGVPVIYQGVLHDYEEKLYGCADLIVRSDYLDKIFDVYIKDYYSDINKGCKFSKNYHYVIVDIKNSTLYLNVDGKTLRNAESIPAFKGQLYIYTKILGKIQDYNHNVAFVLGKKLKLESKHINIKKDDPAKCIGLIDYNNRDKDYILFTEKAIEWIKKMRHQGINWQLLPKPSCTELYPNMKNEKDGNYGKLKKDLASELKEITQIYYCGVKNRELAFNNNIYKFTDDRCNSKNLGFNKGKISNIVDAIININKQNIDKFLPKKVNFNWKKIDETILEVYLDFETMNSLLKNVDEMIFMIGIGIDMHNYQDKVFVLENTDLSSELKMIDEFVDYVELLKLENKKEKVVFYHWHDAEVIFFRNAKKRHNLITRRYDFEFRDLKKVFENTPIVIKDCYNFKLKSVGNALYNINEVNVKWDDNSVCSNGRSAMVLAYNLYQKYSNNLHSNNYSNNYSNNIQSNLQNIMNEPYMKDIIHYNKIDVRMLNEIMKFLRRL